MIVPENARTFTPPPFAFETDYGSSEGVPGREGFEDLSR